MTSASRAWAHEAPVPTGARCPRGFDPFRNRSEETVHVPSAARIGGGMSVSMASQTSRFTLVLALGLVAGFTLSACATRRAKDACEEYLDAVDACVAEVNLPQSSCAGVKGKELGYFECLVDWADAGCGDANELLNCTSML